MKLTTQQEIDLLKVDIVVYACSRQLLSTNRNMGFFYGKQLVL